MTSKQLNGIGGASGSSSSTTTTVNGHHAGGGKISIDATANGVAKNPQTLVAVPEMCSYCFDVLDNELQSSQKQLARPSFSNDS